MSSFGPIRDPSLAEASILALLNAWFETYLREVERQGGLEVGYLAKPKALMQGVEWDLYPGDKLPALGVMANDTTYEQVNSDSIGGVLNLSVAVFLKSTNPAQGWTNSHKYMAALATLLEQRGTHDGVLSALWVVDSSLERFPSSQGDNNRTLFMGVLDLKAKMDNLINPLGGPLGDTPPLDPLLPGGDWPTVLTTKVGITQP